MILAIKLIYSILFKLFLMPYNDLTNTFSTVQATTKCQSVSAVGILTFISFPQSFFLSFISAVNVF